MANDVRIIKLKHPIDCGDGKKVTELKIGRLKAKHLRALPPRLFEKGEKDAHFTIDEVVTILSSLTGIEMKYLDELDAADDIPHIIEVFGDFITACLGATGKS